jgi:hypothetical protein
MYLYKGQGLRLSAAVTPYTLRFKTDDVNDPQLRRLHSRQMSAMAGINGEYSADWGIVEASVMRGHRPRRRFRVAPALQLSDPGRSLHLGPKVGVVHSSARCSTTTTASAMKKRCARDLPPTNPGSATSPSLQIAVSTPLGTKWRDRRGRQPVVRRCSEGQPDGTTRHTDVGLRFPDALVLIERPLRTRTPMASVSPAAKRTRSCVPPTWTAPSASTWA